MHIIMYTNIVVLNIPEQCSCSKTQRSVHVPYLTPRHENLWGRKYDYMHNYPWLKADVILGRKKQPQVLTRKEAGWARGVVLKL